MLIVKRPLKKDELPELYPKVERKEYRIDEKGWDKIGGHLLRKGIDWMPRPGMQEQMCLKDVNTLFLGGEPQGGKTYGILLAALMNIERPGYKALIIKKELVSTEEGGGSITDNAKDVYMGWGNCEYNKSVGTFTFPQWGSSIAFTHSNFTEGFDGGKKGERAAQEKAKNFQAEFIAFDELTQHDFSIWNFWHMRNRGSSGAPLRMVCTFNTNNDHFTRTMIDWYIGEDGLVIPERNGKVRYYMLEGETERDFIWGDTKEEVLAKAKTVNIKEKQKAKGMTAERLVKSFCFINIEATDNDILLSETEGQTLSNIYNLGSTERERLYGNNWNADNSKDQLTVSKKMVKEIWNNPIDTDTTLYAALDVSGGGDNCPFMVRRGLTIIAYELLDLSNIERKDRPKYIPDWINTKLREYGISPKRFCYDATGMGWYLESFVDGRPVVANTKTIVPYDQAGNPNYKELYFNLRSQLYGKAQMLFETGQIACTIDRHKLYPHGSNKVNKTLEEILIEESETFKRIQKDRGRFYFRNKTEFKKKFAYSPDFMDALVISMIFEIEDKRFKEEAPTYTREDYYREMNKNRNRWR